MMKLSVTHTILASIALGISPVAGAKAATRRRLLDGGAPGLPYDPDTTPYCTWWIDYSSAVPCEQILSSNFITLDEFRGMVSIPGLVVTCWFITLLTGTLLEPDHHRRLRRLNSRSLVLRRGPGRAFAATVYNDNPANGDLNTHF